MTSTEPDPPDPLVASVLSTGIWLGLIDREDVVAWADRCIEKTEQPPSWMIDLSLSHNLHIIDVLKLLDGIGHGVDPEATCKGVYGFLADPGDLTFESAEKLAARLYEIARHCLKDNWNYGLLREADEIDDNFLFVRDGLLSLTKQEAVEEVQSFLMRNRDNSVSTFIKTLASHDPEH